MTTEQMSTASRGDNPIRRVSVISTGTVQIRPEHVGPTRQNTYLWLLLTARAWTPPRPINVYVIEHRDGLVLFDTGQDIASVTDPAYFPGGVTGYLYDRLATFAIEPAQTLTAGLRRLGYAPDDVHSAVVSHLHQDHIGGLSELRAADIAVAEQEWQGMLKPFSAPRGFLRSHIELPGLRWRESIPSRSPRRASRRSVPGTTCSATARSSSCQPPATPLDRSHCLCDAQAGHRC